MNLGERIMHAAGRGLHEGLLADAGMVLEEARKRAPIGGPDDEHRGELRKSGHIESERHAVLIVFDVAWASDQHEHFDYQHTSGGEPKYLENALKALAGQLEEAVAHKVKTHVERIRT